MNRKIQFRDIIIIVLVIILVFQWFDSNQANNKDDNNVTIVLPEEKGSTGEVVLKEVKIDTVYVPKIQKQIIVDKEYKIKYEQAVDSIEKLNLYLEAITINTYEGILVNDDKIQITGKAQVRGALNNYKIDYTLKEKEFTYEPKTVVKQPSLSMGLGVEAGFPTKQGTNLNTKVNLDFYNSKGNGLGVSYDSEQRVWLRLSKNFTIKK